MQLAFEQYWPLLLLPLALGLWWVRRKSLIEFHPRQLDIMVALRAAAFVLVALALAQPVLHRHGSWLSVVYLLDVSNSIEPRSIEEGIQWIESAVAAGGADSSRFMAFGANALATEDAGSLRRVPVSEGASAVAVDRSATDLAGAVERAMATVPAYHVPRLVLVSDGRSTRGELGDVVDRLRLEGVRAYTVGAQPRAASDSWIDSVEVADTVTAGRPFPLRVSVYSQSAVQGTLMVLQGTTALASEPLTLAAGQSASRALRPVLEEEGDAEVDVVFRVEGDPTPGNNQVRLGIHARGRARVLYVEGRPASANFLTDALEGGGFEVEASTPLRMPQTPEDFARYDAVIMSDVDPRTVLPRTMRALESYVSDLGGGFVMAGGEAVFGEEGYADTPVERVLPIWFKAEREPKDLALVIALDKSYSMVGDKMAMAKEASKAAVDLLEDDQRFGLLAFDYHFYWPVPLRLADDKVSIRDRISAIEASSPTNIYPALQDVYLALQATDAEIKHVILLSDGKTYEDDYETLLTRMKDDEITVSTVAVGDKADRDLLANIATWGGGRTYYIEDPTRVPEIFVDETERAQGVTLEEDAEVLPIVRKSIEALEGIDLDTVPPLLGFVRAMAKDNAEIVLETEEEDPVLARWQYGLGRSVFFAGDVKNRWSARWLEWDGYGKFWAQLLRETIRQEDFREPGFAVVRVDGGAEVQLDLVDATGRYRNTVRPTVQVTVDGVAETLQLDQVGPGLYEIFVPLRAEQEAAFLWQATGASIQRRLAAVPDEEQKYRPVDVAALSAFAEATGGGHAPSFDELFDAGDQTISRPLRLWPGLAALALVFYLANLLLRRVRVIKEAAA